jgi:hypothetical protein
MYRRTVNRESKDATAWQGRLGHMKRTRYTGYRTCTTRTNDRVDVAEVTFNRAW